MLKESPKTELLLPRTKNKINNNKNSFFKIYLLFLFEFMI